MLSAENLTSFLTTQSGVGKNRSFWYPLRSIPKDTRCQEMNSELKVTPVHLTLSIPLASGGVAEGGTPFPPSSGSAGGYTRNPKNPYINIRISYQSSNIEWPSKVSKAAKRKNVACDEIFFFFAQFRF
jgi:hypothetical protein